MSKVSPFYVVFVILKYNKNKSKLIDKLDVLMYNYFIKSIKETIKMSNNVSDVQADIINANNKSDLITCFQWKHVLQNASFQEEWDIRQKIY